MHDRSLSKFMRILDILDIDQTGSVLWFIYHFVFGVYEHFSLCCILAFCCEKYLGLNILESRKEENWQILKDINWAYGPHVLCDKCCHRVLEHIKNGSDI